MSPSPRPAAGKLALAAAAVVLAAAGAAASIGAAAASPAARPAAAVQTDHQLCYTVTSAGGFAIPGRILLKNQFSPNGFRPKIASPPVLHCNPVEKILPTGKVYPVTNPRAHLLCFPITAPTTQPAPMVSVANQFGVATLQPGQPNRLCLPTWKSLTAPPGQAASQPPGLSHYTCYPVKEVSGAYTPPAVMLKDEFTPKPVSAQVGPVPDELCLPTVKIVVSATGRTVYKPVAGAMHLLCFPVTPTPVISPVFDQNQFTPTPPGGVPVGIGRTLALCLPSTKKIVGGG